MCVRSTQSCDKATGEDGASGESQPATSGREVGTPSRATLENRIYGNYKFLSPLFLQQLLHESPIKTRKSEQNRIQSSVRVNSRKPIESSGAPGSLNIHAPLFLSRNRRVQALNFKPRLMKSG